MAVAVCFGQYRIINQGIPEIDSSIIIAVGGGASVQRRSSLGAPSIAAVTGQTEAGLPLFTVSATTGANLPGLYGTLLLRLRHPARSRVLVV